ncbi:MAG TPA: DUF1493 family protein [Acidobacteriota bacterium]|nr:DUF1493 family protein [Acidobacteriota bacterium]
MNHHLIGEENETYRRVKRFIADFRRTPESKITPESRIPQDLGIDGDDASEFLGAFMEGFEVDMSDFEFSKYFQPEGCNPFFFVYSLFFKRDNLRSTPLTVGDLVRSAEQHRWVEPEAEPTAFWERTSR